MQHTGTYQHKSMTGVAIVDEENKKLLLRPYDVETITGGAIDRSLWFPVVEDENKADEDVVKKLCDDLGATQCFRKSMAANPALSVVFYSYLGTITCNIYVVVVNGFNTDLQWLNSEMASEVFNKQELGDVLLDAAPAAVLKRYLETEGPNFTFPMSEIANVTQASLPAGQKVMASHCTGEVEKSMGKMWETCGLHDDKLSSPGYQLMYEAWGQLTFPFNSYEITSGQFIHINKKVMATRMSMPNKDLIITGLSQKTTGKDQINFWTYLYFHTLSWNFPNWETHSQFYQNVFKAIIGQDPQPQPEKQARDLLAKERVNAFVIMGLAALKKWRALLDSEETAVLNIELREFLESVGGALSRRQDPNRYRFQGAVYRVAPNGTYLDMKGTVLGDTSGAYNEEAKVLMQGGEHGSVLTDTVRKKADDTRKQLENTNQIGVEDTPRGKAKKTTMEMLEIPPEEQFSLYPEGDGQLGHEAIHNILKPLCSPSAIEPVAGPRGLYYKLKPDTRATMETATMQLLDAMSGREQALPDQSNCVLDMAAPVYIVGDLRGCLDTYKKIERLLWRQGPMFCPAKIVVMGNLFAKDEKTSNNLELISFLIAHKYLARDRIFFLKGDEDLTDLESKLTCGNELRDKIKNLFLNRLPIAARIEKRMWLGGLYNIQKEGFQCKLSPEDAQQVLSSRHWVAGDAVEATKAECASEMKDGVYSTGFTKKFLQMVKCELHVRCGANSCGEYPRGGFQVAHNLQLINMVTGLTDKTVEAAIVLLERATVRFFVLASSENYVFMKEDRPATGTDVGTGKLTELVQMG